MQQKTPYHAHKDNHGIQRWGITNHAIDKAGCKQQGLCFLYATPERMTKKGAIDRGRGEGRVKASVWPWGVVQWIVVEALGLAEPQFVVEGGQKVG